MIPNTFHLPATARQYIEYSSLDELRTLLSEHQGEPVLAVGAGSNLLFTKPFEGVVLHSAMRRARALSEDADSVLIEAEAGLVLDELIEQTVDMGLTGLENLSLIPGEVGASAVQNVGAYGVEAKDVIVEVRAVAVADVAERVFANADCNYGYRDSIFKRELKGQYVITSVVYRLSKHADLHLDYGGVRQALAQTFPDKYMLTDETSFEAVTAAEVREAIIKLRRQKLPDVSEYGSAGSFFTNPVISKEQFLALQAKYPAIPHFDTGKGVKVPAAWLIEQCGYKGVQRGGARVWDRQPLVIVNTGAATAEDIVALATMIIGGVKERFGISLTPEVNYI